MRRDKVYKKYSILLALIITILLVTACGSKKEKSLLITDSREYVISNFPIPSAYKANSSVIWTTTDEKNISGNLTIDLVVPDPATLDANTLVQDFLNRALAINKDGKVTIDRFDLQVTDANQISLVMANYIFNGQDFDGNYWSAESANPLQDSSQNPNQTYPIQPFVPIINPTPYP